MRRQSWTLDLKGLAQSTAHDSLGPDRDVRNSLAPRWARWDLNPQPGDYEGDIGDKAKVGWTGSELALAQLYAI